MNADLDSEKTAFDQFDKKMSDIQDRRKKVLDSQQQLVDELKGTSDELHRSGVQAIGSDSLDQQPD